MDKFKLREHLIEFINKYGIKEMMHVVIEAIDGSNGRV